ncbi:FapA family protein [Gemmatimonadota bacterium]
MSEDSVKIKVDLRNDDTEAYVVVPPPCPEESDSPPLTAHDIRQALGEAGVVNGIQEEALTKIFSECLFEQEVLAAKGTPVEDGKDGCVEYFFNNQQSFEGKEDEDGRVNYKDVSFLINVTKGEKICRIFPPVEGKPGLTVTGKTIDPRPGKEIQVPQGENTEINPANPLFLFASLSGCVRVNQMELVEVQPFLDIKGDVDYSTGNIFFNGSLKVNGDITSGFKVKVTGDLEVNGCVEDAEVEVEGDVIIKNGFIGHGQGTIRAGGDITLKFVQGQNIICEGDLTVGGEILQGHIEVGGDIHVDGRKGVIIGGEIKTLGSVDSTQIGNSTYTRTEVFAGCTSKLEDRLAEIEKELAELSEKMKKFKECLSNLLLQKKKNQDKFTPDQQTLFDRLKETGLSYQKLQKELEEEREQTKNQIEQHQDCHIKVNKTVFPGVNIAIGHSHQLVKEQLNNKVFREVKGKILAA